MVEKAIRSLLHAFDEPNNEECVDLIKTRERERAPALEKVRSDAGCETERRPGSLHTEEKIGTQPERKRVPSRANKGLPLSSRRCPSIRDSCERLTSVLSSVALITKSSRPAATEGAVFASPRSRA